MNRSVLILFVAVLLLPLSNAGAGEIRAFHNVNQLPFRLIFGLPSLDNSPLTDAGRWRLNVITNLSNTFNRSIDADENIVTDVETLRSSLVVNYGLRDNLQLTVEVPHIRHDSGFLDDFIYEWHDFFNMPQNGRTKDNNDLLEVSYSSNSGSSVPLDDSASGLGDIRIGGAFSKPWQNRTLIFSGELKLPTGDYESLTGSGGYDVSLGFTLNDPHSLRKYRITLFGGLAGTYLGDIDGELANVQNSFAVSGRAGIGWQATKHIQLKLQLDGHSPLYDSDIKEMGDGALQLIVGGSLTFTDNIYLDISVAEDVSTTTAADVAFQLALVASF